jgi:hypothetical protein
MSSEFLTRKDIIVLTDPGDLCWLDEDITVFDDQQVPNLPNITYVVRRNELMLVIDPCVEVSKDRLGTGHKVKVIHFRHGIGLVSRFAKVTVLVRTEPTL